MPLSLLLTHFDTSLPHPSILPQTLYAVSDPESSSYGQHMSFDEVSALVAPEQGVVNKVMAAVSDHILATASASTGAAT